MKLFKHPHKIVHPWMVFLRCSVSALALIHFIAIQPDFGNILSANAFIPPDIADVLKYPLIPSIYSIHRAVNLDYNIVLSIFRIVYPLSLLLLFSGLFTRVSAAFSLLLQLIITNSMDFYTYGVDVFTTIALFYCVIFPVGAEVSLDSYIFKNKRAITQNADLYLWVFRGHVCIIYFFSGFEKLLGANWRNGESIWKMVHSYNTLPFVDLTFLYRTPFFLLIGWGTMLLETLYPVFINIPKTSKPWLVAVITFHIIIAFFMGLYFFSAMMIILNLTAYYIPIDAEIKGNRSVTQILWSRLISRRLFSFFE